MRYNNTIDFLIFTNKKQNYYSIKLIVFNLLLCSKLFTLLFIHHLSIDI